MRSRPGRVPGASGRYIAMDEPGMPMTELIELMREFGPSIKVKAKVLPGFVISLAAFIDLMGHVSAGRPRELTRALVKELTTRHAAFNTDKIRRELGWQPRDTRECVKDTVAWLKEHKPGPRYTDAQRSGSPHRLLQDLTPSA
jgi:nucleoside-diphosphate-sugar epimerase